ncbi:AarF/UbiB family protein [Peptococcaceae bacterium]|nr:AarF/UbiB family protein [Peptococcaceae bacterium]
MNEQSKKELDFSYEASHIERFIENFRYEKTVHIPRVYKQYSTKKILTMEFIDGIKITDINAILKSGSNPKILADRGANAILKQIFEHGFFHADPHPGNIFALKNNVICFLDFGMVSTLLPKHKEYLSQMIIGIITKDTKKITHSILQLSQNKHIENIESLEYRIFELLENFLSVPLRDINTGEVLNDLLKIIIDYKLKMPPNIYLLLKALINIEGVGRKLNPNFNIMKHLKPKVHKILKMQFTPKKK